MNKQQEKIEQTRIEERKKIIDEIIIWSRSNCTGHIDELYEVNLSALLRFLNSIVIAETVYD